MTLQNCCQTWWFLFNMLSPSFVKCAADSGHHIRWASGPYQASCCADVTSAERSPSVIVHCSVSGPDESDVLTEMLGGHTWHTVCLSQNRFPGSCRSYRKQYKTPILNKLNVILIIVATNRFTSRWYGCWTADGVWLPSNMHTVYPISIKRHNYPFYKMNYKQHCKRHGNIVKIMSLNTEYGLTLFSILRRCVAPNVCFRLIVELYF